MNGPAGSPGILRVATCDDIPLLVRHHRMMFAEIRGKSGNPDPALLEVLAREYEAKLNRDMPAGTCVAWGVQAEDDLVSSGAISIASYVPVLHDSSSRIAFLHSIYTEQEYRHRHFARMITQAAADYCKSHGIRRLYLFASEAGRPVYEKAGFVPVPNMMLLLQ
jgi:GNAT superfamily N-acetyltransferase